jgi:hypothetical protein
MVLCLSALVFTLPGGDALAKHRGRRVIISPYIQYPGRYIQKIPPGHRVIRHRGARYYYHKGIFYRPAFPGFVVVTPPVGVVVGVLPAGFKVVWVGGLKYFYFGGVFYKPAPRGYVVVEAPPEVVVAEELPPVVTPTEAEKSGGKVAVNTHTLNVRTGPGLEYAVLYQVSEGDTLQVRGRRGGWLYIEMPDGKFGWLMVQYTYWVEPETPAPKG